MCDQTPGNDDMYALFKEFNQFKKMQEQGKNDHNQPQKMKHHPKTISKIEHSDFINNYNKTMKKAVAENYLVSKKSAEEKKPLQQQQPFDHAKHHAKHLDIKLRTAYANADQSNHGIINKHGLMKLLNSIGLPAHYAKTLIPNLMKYNKCNQTCELNKKTRGIQCHHDKCLTLDEFLHSYHSHIKEIKDRRKKKQEEYKQAEEQEKNNTSSSSHNFNHKEWIKDKLSYFFNLMSNKKTGTINREELILLLSRIGISVPIVHKLVDKMISNDSITLDELLDNYKNLGKYVAQAKCEKMEVEKSGPSGGGQKLSDDEIISKIDGKELMGVYKKIFEMKKELTWRPFVAKEYNEGNIAFDCDNEYRVKLTKDDGYINVEHVTPKELYFGCDTYNHFYGCIHIHEPKTWHYRFRGQCKTNARDKKKWSVFAIQTKGRINFGIKQ